MGVSSSRSQGDDDGERDQESDNGSSRFLLLQRASILQRARGEVDNKSNDIGAYLPLYKAVVKGDWHETRTFIDEDEEALTAKITIASETALHVAVGIGKDHDTYVEKLINRMSPEDLALTDQNGETALSVAAVVGNIKAAKLLVNKNPDLPIIDNGKAGLPIHRAAQCGQKEMIKYLLEVTKNDIESSNLTGEDGGRLLIDIITAEYFDIALQLIEKYPEMATIEVHGHGSPLTVLAGKTSAFSSGDLTRWQQLFYKPFEFFVQLEQLRQKQHSQHDARKLVRRLCKEILKLDDAKTHSLLYEPLLKAAKLGIHEIIEEVLEAYPPAIWASNEEKHNVFQLAVLHRRESVYNLINRMSDYKHLVTRYTDDNDNNILHLAGKLPSPDRLNLVPGAALQVQRELQWFKEVTKLVQPAQKEALNKDGKTPWMVFREAHQQLMKEGEAWLKTTAQSCTVAATLIATIAFNAGLNVPSGSNNKGHPILSNQIAFGVFVVADAISLFSSITTILMFLSILTSRYSEADFDIALPRGLDFGLIMLLISLISMLVSFGATIYLVFGPQKAIIVIPVGLMIVVPATLLVLLQPLIQTIFRSKIFGSGKFHKQSRSILH